MDGLASHAGVFWGAPINTPAWEAMDGPDSLLFFYCSDIFAKDILFLEFVTVIRLNTSFLKRLLSI